MFIPTNHTSFSFKPSCLCVTYKPNDALSQWFPCMAFGRFISSLMCSPSSWEGLSQPSLLLSLCCCTFLVIESSLLPVSWGFEFPTFMSLPHALAFLFNVTVECWHLGWSLIFGVKYGDSSNRLLLSWRQNYLAKYSYSLCHLFSQEGASFCSHNWIFLAES